MRKIILLSTLAILLISATQAQIKPDYDKSRVKKTTPAPAPAPAPVNKTTGTESTPALVYNLTAVRVKIKTGSDNKEFPSQVAAFIGLRNQAKNQPFSFNQFSLTNEMRINSDTEIGLDRNSNLVGETKLEAFQSSGLIFIIRYSPNLIFDAWKIENVTLVLEFRDQFGNLHPTLGSKTIVFNNAYGFLNNSYRFMECVTDGSFAPMTAVIKLG